MLQHKYKYKITVLDGGVNSGARLLVGFLHHTLGHTMTQDEFDFACRYVHFSDSSILNMKGEEGYDHLQIQKVPYVLDQRMIRYKVYVIV